MRAAWLVLLAAALAASVPAPEAADPVEAAMQALHARDARQPEVLEAVVATGTDPTDWGGRDLLHAIAVPAPGPDPVAPLREAYAVLAAGADGRAWDDPVRGGVDLVAQLRDNAPAALASPDDAAQSFQLLAMAAAGLAGAAEKVADPASDKDADTIERLRARLLEQQHPSGAWGCGPWQGPECTGFALAALHATGGIPDDAGQAAAAYVLSTFEGGPFADPLEGADAQVTAWAVQALRLTQTPVPAGTVEWVLSQQQADGMWHVAGRPSAWATAEVVVMLAGGHPVGTAAP